MESDWLSTVMIILFPRDSKCSSKTESIPLNFNKRSTFQTKRLNLWKLNYVEFIYAAFINGNKEKINEWKWMNVFSLVHEIYFRNTFSPKGSLSKLQNLISSENISHIALSTAYTVQQLVFIFSSDSITVILILDIIIC